MASSNKNERAWTPQDVKALECAMINKLEIGITSIDQAEIPNPNKLPLEAKPTDFWGRKLELEKSIFINSSILVKEMVAKVENAKENDDKEVLFAVLIEIRERLDPTPLYSADVINMVCALILFWGLSLMLSMVNLKILSLNILINNKNDTLL